MRKLFIVLIMILSISAKSQFSLVPHNIALSYYGQGITHPGAKLSLMYTLDHWNKVNKSKQGLAKVKTRDINLNITTGFFYHKRYQTGIFILPEIEFSQSNKKGWYWAVATGLGYQRTIIYNTYEVQEDGTVNAVNAGNNYGLINFSFTYGKDFYIAKKKRFKVFLKPQFNVAFPNFPAVTGYFFLEAGLAYKLRYL